MFERFTDRARKVMALANHEAQRFNHEYIGTEHILLGIVKEGSGVGALVLKNLDIDLRKVRLEVEKVLKRGPDEVTTRKLPQTPRAKKVIEYAIEESYHFAGGHCGTEHLLLGLLREKDGVAAFVLTNLGLNLDEVRRQIINTFPKDAADNAHNTHPSDSRIEQALEASLCTDRTRNVINHAVEECQKLGHSRLGTEHLLLGLLHDQDSIAALILAQHGLHLDAIRAQIMALLDQG